MIITMSPAKTLDYKSHVSVKEHTQPQYAKEAEELNKLLAKYSAEDIAGLMSINPQIAHNVYGYIQGFTLPNTPQRQAVFAYNGIAYQGLQPETLSVQDLEYAQDHLVHISGLYGVLRPLDMIKPYRLEMQIPLANNKGKTLYDFWSEKISKHIADMMAEDDNTWINLSSKEYAKAVNPKLLPKGHKFITPIFKQSNGKGYKQIVVYAKKARGMMTRFIIQNRLTDIEHLKAFDTEGYCFSPQLSTDTQWVFIR